MRHRPHKGNDASESRLLAGALTRGLLPRLAGKDPRPLSAELSEVARARIDETCRWRDAQVGNTRENAVAAAMGVLVRLAFAAFVPLKHGDCVRCVRRGRLAAAAVVLLTEPSVLDRAGFSPPAGLSALASVRFVVARHDEWIRVEALRRRCDGFVPSTKQRRALYGLLALLDRDAKQVPANRLAWTRKADGVAVQLAAQGFELEPEEVVGEVFLAAMERGDLSGFTRATERGIRVDEKGIRDALRLVRNRPDRTASRSVTLRASRPRGHDAREVVKGPPEDMERPTDAVEAAEARRAVGNFRARFQGPAALAAFDRLMHGKPLAEAARDRDVGVKAARLAVKRIMRRGRFRLRDLA